MELGYSNILAFLVYYDFNEYDSIKIRMNDS